jgi:hypothetical protein
MPHDDQFKNLESDLRSLQTVFDKCVADGDVPGFTRAKARIKKLEALRQQQLNERSDTDTQSTTTASGSIEFRPAALKDTSALDIVDTSTVSPLAPVEHSSSEYVDAPRHSHEAPVPVRQTVTRSLTDHDNAAEPRNIEGALLDEFDHDKPKPAQSLAMLLLESLERSALAQDEAEYSKSDLTKKEHVNAGNEIIGTSDAIVPDNASAAEGIVGELARLADEAKEGEGSEENRSISSETPILDSEENSALHNQIIRQAETSAEIVSTGESQGTELPQKSTSSNMSGQQMSHVSVDKMPQIEVQQPKTSAAPASSAKKEIAKFWKFITKPEEFMEDQNAQDQPDQTQNSSESKK